LLKPVRLLSCGINQGLQSIGQRPHSQSFGGASIFGEELEAFYESSPNHLAKGSRILNEEGQPFQKDCSTIPRLVQAA
jgi:hypothetical protein